MLRSWTLSATRVRCIPRSTSIATAPATTRHASLSAIHRGLRKSEKIQYGEARPRLAQSRREPRRKDDRANSLTAKALAGAGSKRQQNRLLKKRGRKEDDLETLKAKVAAGAKTKSEHHKLLQQLRRKQQEEDGTGPKTRRKRFNDPELSFGKKSLVYQLKQGHLQSHLHKIEKPVQPRTSDDSWSTAPRPNRSFERTSPSAFADRFADRRHDGPERKSGRSGRSNIGQTSRRRVDTRHDSEPRSSNGTAFRRPGLSQSVSGRAGDRSSSATQSSSGSTRYGRQEGENGGLQSNLGLGNARVSAPAPRERKGNLMPLTIEYATAASQFLFGKSVVTSALEQKRRKFYRLYIYDGENHNASREKMTISRLAASAGVPITIVPQEDQRLMDKMSHGRPHNGFVLETSPLPQMPITALGELVETPEQLGFHISLGHQTKEEAEINGEETFVRRSSNVTAKPFVLLLNEILDPGNLGGILRTASYFGVDAVCITSRNSASLTPVVLKSAAGAVEEITIFSVASPVQFLEASRKAGWKSFAAAPPPDRKLARRHAGKFTSTEAVEEQNPLTRDPCILVLGNEGFGLSKDIKKAADYELSFPHFVQDSCVDSLNVSVAAGLLCHAFVKRAPSTSGTPSSQRKLSPEAPSGTETAESAVVEEEKDQGKLF